MLDIVKLRDFIQKTYCFSFITANNIIRRFDGGHGEKPWSGCEDEITCIINQSLLEQRRAKYRG